MNKWKQGKENEVMKSMLTIICLGRAATLSAQEHVIRATEGPRVSPRELLNDAISSAYQATIRERSYTW